MADSSGPATGALRRYWPVGVAIVVIAAVVAVGVLSGSDDDDPGDVATPGIDTTTGDDASGEPTDDELTDIEAWAALDPMDAPDCDRDTGRIMIPSVYAPNCVALWPEGADNGGATHRGITADEIVVAVYVGQTAASAQGSIDALGLVSLTDEEIAENRDKLVSAHNDLFETFGRQVRWERLDASGGGSDEAAARADAIEAAEEIGAFAVIGGPSGTTAFADELVARQVICICTDSQPIELYQRWAPYVWSGLMASTQGYVHIADYLETRLAGKVAEFAGDPAFHDRERTFGLVWYETADGSYQEGTNFFLDRIDAMGLELEIDISYIYGTGDRLSEDASAIITRLKSLGVTTVIFGGDPFMPIHLTNQATDQDYYPEWMMSGFTLLDFRGFARQYHPDQWRNAFGLSLILPPIDPDVAQREGNLVSWHLGEELSSYPGFYNWGRFFTAVHLAGPVLTPETFRDGLFSFKPVSGFQTEYGVSYGHGLWPWPDYLGADDVTEIWWDPDAIDPTEVGTEVRGMYRYTDKARRYGPDQLDQIEGRLFDLENTVTYFEERPAGDTPPRYPRRSGREG